MNGQEIWTWKFSTDNIPIVFETPVRNSHQHFLIQRSPSVQRNIGSIGSRQHQPSHCKVDAWKIIEARMGYDSTSTLFCYLSNYLPEKKFDDVNDLKMRVVNFFGQKSQDFYQSVGDKS